MKKLSSYNTISKIFFLLLTPAFFRVFNVGFIWHSIYWGVITFIVLIWMLFILISPLVGRIGCGWFCFMGSIQDQLFKNSFIKMKQRKPLWWLRILFTVSFFATSITFFIIHLKGGVIHGIRFEPNFFGTELNNHYRHVWVYDITGGILAGLLLEKRWACKNICAIGSLCAVGSTYSRLLPVVDTEKCNTCKKCENECLANIPITQYIETKNGMVTNSECFLCGKCVSACNKDAISIKFVWNREKYFNAVEKTKTNCRI